jgi:hypothetical protein
MKEIAKYNNGNTTVSIMSDGTKIRECEGVPVTYFPESIDVKITDYCDMGCAYCHESSTTKGVHADLEILLEVIEELPAGVELAIGGGNPLSHPNLLGFLHELKIRGIIANLTVNQGHLKTYQDQIMWFIKNDFIKGLGISVTNNNFNYIKPLLEITDNVVYHLIAGVNKVEDVEKLIELGKCKVLVLGYKLFGFGVKYHNAEVDSELKKWYKHLPSLVGKCTLSFDNLAIEQLNVKRLFTHDGWNKFYMGDDFCFTMYIDAVKKEYAPTSRSKNRVSYDKYSLNDYFIKYRNL